MLEPALDGRSRRMVRMSIGPAFDSVLVAARSGAEWAWATIYRDLAGPVAGYFAAHGARDPEDLTSEVFLSVARDIHSFEGDEPAFRSWVFVIAHRRLVDSWRAVRRRPQTVPLTEICVDPVDGDVEADAVERLATRELLSLFGRLTDDQRSVIALRVIGGLTLAETALVLGRRVGAVKALQHRAIMTLRAMLRDRQ